MEGAQQFMKLPHELAEYDLKNWKLWKLKSHRKAKMCNVMLTTVEILKEE